jgi:hypothetical protein
MSEPTIERQLAGAELWARTGSSDPQTRFLAGWEDGATFCAAVCTTDLGLAFCRACPTDVATRALDSGRAASGRSSTEDVAPIGDEARRRRWPR